MRSTDDAFKTCISYIYLWLTSKSIHSKTKFSRKSAGRPSDHKAMMNKAIKPQPLQIQTLSRPDFFLGFTVLCCFSHLRFNSFTLLWRAIKYTFISFWHAEFDFFKHWPIISQKHLSFSTETYLNLNKGK